MDSGNENLLLPFEEASNAAGPAWSTLSQSVLDGVFAFLRPLHLQSCSLVCKHWRVVACGLVVRLTPQCWDSTSDTHLVQNFPNLVALEFRALGSFRKADLGTFRGLQHLTSLVLASRNGLRRLDTGIAELHIVDLDLSGCHDLDSCQLQHLSILTTLRNLAVNRSLAPADLVGLVQSCPQLHDLSLKSLQTQHYGSDYFKPLAQLTDLRALNLDHCSHLGARDLVRLSGLLNLSSLSLAGVGIADIAPVSALTSLTDVNLSFNRKLENSGLQALAPLTQMRRLNLQGCRPLTGSGLRSIMHLTTITELNVKDMLMTFPLGSQPLTAFINLHSLAVSGATFVMTSFTPHGQLVDQVASSHAERLTHLDLGGCLLYRGAPDSATRSPLECLVACSRLSSLQLDGTRSICDQDFKVFAALPRLEQLLLPVNDRRCMEYTDAGMEHLAACTRLNRLQMDLANMTLAGLALLSSLSRLTQLTLAHSSVVAHVGRLPHHRLWEVQKAVNGAFHTCLDLEILQLLPDLSAVWTAKTLKAEFKLCGNLYQAFRPATTTVVDEALVDGCVARRV